MLLIVFILDNHLGGVIPSHLSHDSLRWYNLVSVTVRDSEVDSELLDDLWLTQHILLEETTRTRAGFESNHARLSHPPSVGIIKTKQHTDHVFVLAWCAKGFRTRCTNFNDD